MSMKNKAATAAFSLLALSGQANAQSPQNDSIPPQHPKETTNKTNDFVSFFENIYSNALYLKYRTDAGINPRTPTPSDMIQKIEKDASKAAQTLYEMKKNKVPNADIMEKYQEQLSGVIASDNGRDFSYPYTKDGKRRMATATLTGEATNFIQLEKEEREFRNFMNVQKELMDKKTR